MIHPPALPCRWKVTREFFRKTEVNSIKENKANRATSSESHNHINAVTEGVCVGKNNLMK